MIARISAEEESFFYFQKRDKFRDIKGTDLGWKGGLNQEKWGTE